MRPNKLNKSKVYGRKRPIIEIFIKIALARRTVKLEISSKEK